VLIHIQAVILCKIDSFLLSLQYLSTKYLSFLQKQLDW